MNAGLEPNFQLIEKPPSLPLPAMAAAGEQFDLIYIDGLHVFEHTLMDFYYAANLATTDGVSLFDDCRSPHVDKVIRFVRTNMAEWLKLVDFRRGYAYL
jgi:hypothetical protein